MKLAKQLLELLLRPLRQKLLTYAETQLSLPYGVAQFIGNVAYVQITPEEAITLRSPSLRLSDIVVTAKDMRPLLTYRYWPKGMTWQAEMPLVQAIVEINKGKVRLQVRSNDEWESVGITDERVAPLRDLFLSFSFYQPIRKEHKVRKEIVSAPEAVQA